MDGLKVKSLRPEGLGISDCNAKRDFQTRKISRTLSTPTIALSRFLTCVLPMLQACCKRALPNGRASIACRFYHRSAARNHLAPSRAYHASTCLSLQQEGVPLRKQLKDEAKAKRAQNASRANASATPEVNRRLSEWELTVGIEVHAQLNTARKLFSDASTSSTEEPNTRVAQFDLSVPGSLPIFQKATLIPALRAAVALNCSIQPVSRFDRKHYFYHDQPAGYQITQYYEPFARDGSINLNANDCSVLQTEEEVQIGIKQIQMEQDTAKTQDRDEQTSLIDYNRAGHPLIEIISLPHIHCPEVASAYVRKIQAILLSVDAVTTGMEMGGLRADINVSVRRKGAAPGEHSYSGIAGLGQRTEIKNIGTLKGIEDAIRAERDRQISVLEAGGSIEGETRGWSITKPGETRRLRGKEGEVDYRYMPDPDIPPLRISPEVVKHLSQTLPPVPDRLQTLMTDEKSYGLSLTDAKILLSLDDGERLDYFQDVVQTLTILQEEEHTDKAEDGADVSNSSPCVDINPSTSRLAVNWVLHELGSLLSKTETPWAENRVRSDDMSNIIHQTSIGNITGSSAKQILKMVFEGDERGVLRIIEGDGLAFRPLCDEEYASLARKVIEANPTVVKDIQEKGKHGKVMFLVGQIMRHGEEGRVEAKKAESVLRELLF